MINSLSGFLLNNIPITSVNSTPKPCDDNYVGIIEYDGANFKGYNGSNQFGLQRNAKCSNNNSYQRISIDYRMFNPKSSNRKIVILLESPHVSEFKPKFNGVTTGPALGNSANTFNAQSLKVFNNNISVLCSALQLTNSAENFDVYFVNAIQYQCSLGLPKIKPKLRDFIFEALWNRQPNSFKDDLIERLNIVKPDLIINACTRELQKTCCNSANIISGLKGYNCSFLTASSHILCWNQKTIIL